MSFDGALVDRSIDDNRGVRLRLKGKAGE